MTNPTVPAGYHAVQPYLIVAGAEKALAFYASAFGAKQRLCMKGKDGRVGHAEIEIGDSCVMMADEHPEGEIFGPNHYGGSAARLMIYAADCDAVYNQALAAGATSVREPADQPYGDRMAGILDPFGYTWYIGTQIKQMSKEELENLG